MIALTDTDLSGITHVIQSALTPIFLLSAVATLLGTFTTRLARISDQVEKFAADLPGAEAASVRERRLRLLRQRSHALDVAVALAAFAGACTCGTVLTLFLGALRAQAAAAILFLLFGVAICCTIGALSAFLVEMLLASRHVRAEVERHEDRAG